MHPVLPPLPLTNPKDLKNDWRATPAWLLKPPLLSTILQVVISTRHRSSTVSAIASDPFASNMAAPTLWHLWEVVPFLH